MANNGSCPLMAAFSEFVLKANSDIMTYGRLAGDKFIPAEPPARWKQYDPQGLADWPTVARLIFEHKAGPLFSVFIGRLLEGWPLENAVTGGPPRGYEVSLLSGALVDRGAPAAPSALAAEAARLLQALQKNLGAMTAFDREPGRKHALAELAGGSLLGPVTRAVAVVQQAREALGEPSPASVRPPAAAKREISIGDLGSDAQRLVDQLGQAGFAALAQRYGGTARGVQKDLQEIALQGYRGSLSADKALVNAGNAILTEILAESVAARK